MKETAQQVLSTLHPRSIRALPAHNPRTGHGTLPPYGFVMAVAHDSVIVTTTATTTTIVVDDNNAGHRGFA